MVGASSYTTEKCESAVNGMVQEIGEVFISVRNLPVKKYRTVLKMDIHHGEIIGVAGLQGHGQADIVRDIFGINGKIQITKNGIPVSIKNPRQAIKNRFAFISGDREKEGSFQRHNLVDNVAVVSDLVLDQKLKNVDEVFKESSVKYSSSFQNITSLSGGNQQKVLFCRWTSVVPNLLLADDPSKGIDVQARSEMRQLLERLSRNGMAMIIVSSDEDELVMLCANKKNARVIVLYEGNIIETLTGSDITRNNIISAALGQRRN
jgi:ABC-type sugar transport system ATPase subunit